MNLQVLMFYQDDPKKCTAAKITIEFIKDLSLGNKVFSEKGSKTSPLFPIFLILLAMELI